MSNGDALGTVELDIGAPPVTVGVIRIRLYCWPHRAVHTLESADVERAVYALGAMAADSYAAGMDDQRRGVTEALVPDLMCLLDVLESTHTDEGYREHVEQGITGRTHAPEWTP